MMEVVVPGTSGRSTRQTRRERWGRGDQMRRTSRSVRWLSAVVTAVAVGALWGCAAPEDGAELDSAGSDSPSVSEAPQGASESEDASEEAATDSETTETEEPKQVRLYPVVSVADGDTITVRYRGRDESIRIIGIDTPETVDPNTPDECWGEEASDTAKRLLDGKKVALVFDASQGRRDAYDRLLAYVVRPGIGDFGLVQIQRGNAIEYTYDTAYKRQTRYRLAERVARRADKGLWKKCGGTDTPLAPAQPKKTPKPKSPGGNCAPGYAPCVAPYPPDLNCPDVDGPVSVTGDDPHGLDADGDGIACES
ncbi:hypothetical protein FXB39_07760 [Nocardioides sp. BGMRC 2183]|nr:hypothetical protein FXB39_07760 [Nocardioides sp. BGMRC 2183]